MAGTKRPKRPKLIDVVAEAYLLLPPEPATEPVPELDLPVLETIPVAPGKCPLGHEQPAGVRFCNQCGMDMSAPPPSQATLEDARPVPTGQLSEQERLERDRQHTEALGLAARFERAPEQYQPYTPQEGESVIIHFIEDGLTAFGKVWYRGEEIEIGPDHPRWPEAKGWVLLSKWEQMDRYGKQYFDQGPWPGQRGFAGAPFEQLATMDKKAKFAGPSPEELRQAEEARLRRGRAIPARVFG